MAEAVLRHQVAQLGLSGQVEVDSTGTGDWHVGESRHPGTRDILRRNGIATSGRARQVTPDDLKAADYVVAMDQANVAALRRIDCHGYLKGKMYLLLDFAGANTPSDVPDPYFTGDFDRVYDLVTAGCEGLLRHIRDQHGL
jgi:protein-tyrosine phosphatase